ncbi:MAG: hypothetical protein QXF61_07165, partial [Nitrososphaeria archaeon]
LCLVFRVGPYGTTTTPSNSSSNSLDRSADETIFWMSSGKQHGKHLCALKWNVLRRKSKRGSGGIEKQSR